MPFILAHTKPGEVVYDCFAGTCSTGFAATACANPDDTVVPPAGTKVPGGIHWGPRRAICVDTGVLPTFIGRTLLRPIDVEEFERISNKTMDDVETRWGWIYEAEDDRGNNGTILNTVFSDIIECNNCGSQSTFLDLFVDFKRGAFKSRSKCPSCRTTIMATAARRATETIYDDLLKTSIQKTKRVPVTINGKIGKRRWTRPVAEKDMATLSRIEKTQLPAFVKPVPMLSGEERWGELYRAGYHKGITHLHHFYTRRNFLALTVLYAAAKSVPEEYRDHFILAVSSYNVAHSSLMTRFVFKKGNRTPVNTSAEPGVLYITGCPVEKNVFQGVRQKIKIIKEAAAEVNKWNPQVYVYTRPAQQSGLPDNSVDYVFTDPPFAGNIQYSEINFLSESWLGAFTDNKFETVISDVQGKQLQDYERLLTEALSENFRVLKAGHYMSVVFHHTSSKVWNSLRRAILGAGFDIVNSSILDKQQTSFKQTTTAGAVKKDLIIVALKPLSANSQTETSDPGTAEQFLRDRLSRLGPNDTPERTFDYLFSRFVGACLSKGKDVPVDAKEFRAALARIADSHGDKWFLWRDR